MNYRIIDNLTGKAPVHTIKEEPWAHDLDNAEGFAIDAKSRLLLCDKCGRFEYCPEGRFLVEYSTVMNDHNGCEIYAGDVIRINYGTPCITARFEVYWNKPMCAWWGRLIRGEATPATNTLCGLIDFGDGEIVGTIREEKE